MTFLEMQASQFFDSAMSIHHPQNNANGKGYDYWKSKWRLTSPKLLHVFALCANCRKDFYDRKEGAIVKHPQGGALLSFHICDSCFISNVKLGFNTDMRVATQSPNQFFGSPDGYQYSNQYNHVGTQKYYGNSNDDDEEEEQPQSSKAKPKKRKINILDDHEKKKKQAAPKKSKKKQSDVPSSPQEEEHEWQDNA